MGTGRSNHTKCPLGDLWATPNRPLKNVHTYILNFKLFTVFTVAVSSGSLHSLFISLVVFYGLVSSISLLAHYCVRSSLGHMMCRISLGLA